LHRRLMNMHPSVPDPALAFLAGPKLKQVRHLINTKRVAEPSTPKLMFKKDKG
jgi:hypothetical protein